MIRICPKNSVHALDLQNSLNHSSATYPKSGGARKSPLWLPTTCWKGRLRWIMRTKRCRSNGSGRSWARRGGASGSSSDSVTSSMPPGKGLAPLGKLSDGLAALLDEVATPTWPSGQRRAKGRRSLAGALLTKSRPCLSGLGDPAVCLSAAAAGSAALADGSAAGVGGEAGESDG